MVSRHKSIARRYAAALFILIALACLLSLNTSPLQGQGSNEKLLSSENAYNPIPSPDGKSIAYVRTGWNRSGGSGGFGRSNLVSEVMVIHEDGRPIRSTALSDMFVAGWIPDASALVCYRDWKYGLVAMDGKITSEGEIPSNKGAERPERVSFLPLPPMGEIVWSRRSSSAGTVIEAENHTIVEHEGPLGDILVPSPDGRYIAMFGSIGEGHLLVYDLQLSKWCDLGPVVVHPDNQWDYLKPTWNPWFADSSHLAFVSGSNLVVSEPDGNAKRSIPIGGYAGLAVPSPDGKFVAYATFDPRPMRVRPDLQFWGGTIIWIMPLIPGGKPIAVTMKNPDETYDLKWLGNDAVVFDRFEDLLSFEHARIWKVSVRGALRQESSLNK